MRACDCLHCISEDLTMQSELQALHHNDRTLYTSGDRQDLGFKAFQLNRSKI